MKRIFIASIGTVFLAGIICFNFFGPYNVLTALTANNLAEYEEIQQQLEGRILHIKYIGNKTYQIKTDKKNYILVENEDYSHVRFEVFEMKRKIEIFKNSM
ncbi:MAG: hypothetical protein ABF649_10380 [Bacillus sp. (in: firmicutes)]